MTESSLGCWVSLSVWWQRLDDVGTGFRGAEGRCPIRRWSEGGSGRHHVPASKLFGPVARRQTGLRELKHFKSAIAWTVESGVVTSDPTLSQCRVRFSMRSPERDAIFRREAVLHSSWQALCVPIGPGTLMIVRTVVNGNSIGSWSQTTPIHYKV